MAHAAQKREAIERGMVYTLGDFLKITRMGSKGLRDAKDDGLRVVYHGRMGYVSGDDFVEWIRDPRRCTQR